MTTIIKDEKLVRIPGSIKPDSKRRVVLPGFLVREDIIYHTYSNSAGQIVLDPQVAVPASEAWLFKNPDAIAAVRRGLAEAAQGKVSKVDISTL